MVRLLTCRIIILDKCFPTFYACLSGSTGRNAYNPKKRTELTPKVSKKHLRNSILLSSGGITTRDVPCMISLLYNTLILYGPAHYLADVVFIFCPEKIWPNSLGFS